MDICAICGEDINKEFKTKLKCGHTYHYECIMKAFKRDPLTSCPYCGLINNRLPIVNGLKQLHNNIHYLKYDEESLIEANNYVNTPCQAILKSGKNKGNICDKNCMLGQNVCYRHKHKG